MKKLSMRELNMKSKPWISRELDKPVEQKYINTIRSFKRKLEKKGKNWLV